MKLRAGAASALLTLPLAACAATQPPQPGPITEAQQLERFAVSQCLMRAFPDTPTAEDARRASGAYVQAGSAQAAVYEDIVAVVAAYPARPYRSKSGESLHVMQCLDLPGDPALIELLKPYRQ